MIRKFLSISTALVSIALAPAVGVAQERAPVTKIEPVHTREFYQAPVERCQQVPIPVYAPPAHRSSYGGVVGSIGDTMFGSTSGLVGAVVGGALGSQIGSGSGRAVATGVGVIVGAAAGDRLERGVVPQTQRGYLQNQCTSYLETRTYERIVGYDVHFTFRGQSRVAFLTYNPGEYVSITETLNVR
jgi:uncharacterized protein YcfJ